LRTFFRYFDCKEATLFGADLQDWSLRYIEERPRSESLVESLHETGLALWQAGAGEGERRRRLRRVLMDEHPSIRAYARHRLQARMRSRCGAGTPSARCASAHRTIEPSSPSTESPGQSLAGAVENHAPIHDKTASPSIATACLVWCLVEPPWWPGKNEGRSE